MKKLKHQVVNINIPEGERFDTQSVKLESGKIERMVLHVLSDPDINVDVKIEDNNSNDLHPYVTYKEYMPTNGNHISSRKEIQFDGNRTVNVLAKSNNDLTKPFKAQIIFYINQDPENY